MFESCCKWKVRRTNHNQREHCNPKEGRKPPRIYGGSDMALHTSKEYSRKMMMNCVVVALGASVRMLECPQSFMRRERVL